MGEGGVYGAIYTINDVGRENRRRGDVSGLPNRKPSTPHSVSVWHIDLHLKRVQRVWGVTWIMTMPW